MFEVPLSYIGTLYDTCNDPDTCINPEFFCDPPCPYEQYRVEFSTDPEILSIKLILVDLNITLPKM